jgi:hypothetical protein
MLLIEERTIGDGKEVNCKRATIILPILMLSFTQGLHIIGVTTRVLDLRSGKHSYGTMGL